MKRTWPRTWASSFHSSDSSPHLLFWPSMRLVFNSTRSCGSFSHMYIVYFYNFKGSRSTFCRRSSDNRFVTVKPWWWEIFLCAWIKYCKNSNTNSHNANDLFTVFLRRTRGLHRQPNTPQCLLFFFFFLNQCTPTKATWGRAQKEKKSNPCLLLVVVFAVKFPFSEVAAGGEGLLTHGALQTLLVPWRVVDPHQEAVGDGTLASFTHGWMMTVRAWNKKGRREKAWTKDCTKQKQVCTQENKIQALSVNESNKNRLVSVDEFDIFSPTRPADYTTHTASLRVRVAQDGFFLTVTRE